MKITFIFNLKFYQIFDKKRKGNFGSKFFETYRILNSISHSLVVKIHFFSLHTFIIIYYASFTIYSLPILSNSSFEFYPQIIHNKTTFSFSFSSSFYYSILINLSLSFSLRPESESSSFLLFYPFRQSFLKKEKEKKISRSGAIHDVTQLIRVTD